MTTIEGGTKSVERQRRNPKQIFNIDIIIHLLVTCSVFQHIHSNDKETRKSAKKRESYSKI